jgi:RNA polymerase sigma-70 factor (ECF subfamily)
LTQRKRGLARFRNVQAMSAAVEDVAPVTVDPQERLEGLFERHHIRLYRFALRLSRNDDHAKDLVQDAFVRAARSRVPEEDDAAAAWLIRVVVNLARDRYRRELVREAFRRITGRDSHDPTESLDAAATVRAALARLPARQRAVVVLHHLEGQDVRDIARTLGISSVTVRWHLAAARKRLAVLIEGKGL